jgi:proliferating cell nuclear antigen
VLKCCNNDDIVTLKSDENGDAMTFMFENQNADRISDFELKLMDIDSEHLGIPDTDYKCTVQMPSHEFQRICRDLAILGDTVTIAVTKEGVKFSVAGEMGSGNMTIKPNEHVDTKDEDRVKVRGGEHHTGGRGAGGQGVRSCRRRLSRWACPLPSWPCGRNFFTHPH